ncbi:MAG: hypothetical protein EA001_14515 [Oscillatoriales cyanobacterium]|nr:MAG: hypothetical protein EA001_14515 [Oscillatoriales cyanobacterium]
MVCGYWRLVCDYWRLVCDYWCLVDAERYFSDIFLVPVINGGFFKSPFLKAFFKIIRTWLQ